MVVEVVMQNGSRARTAPNDGRAPGGERRPSTLLVMRWHELCFAHWRADAEIVARALPAGVELDRFEGDAWLSVVPFRLRGVRVPWLPVAPGFADVPEINLRTYVRANGRRGIWFFSLDASNAMLVRAARVTTALPYYDARIAVSQRYETIAFASERVAAGVAPGAFRARYTPGRVAFEPRPHSLEAFLHDRFRFFAVRRGRLVVGEVEHAPWSLVSCEIEIDENSLGASIAHPLGARPDLCTFARGVAVRASGVRPVAVERAAHGP